LTRANPVGTLLQLRKYPAIMNLLAIVFLWQLAHQVLPSTWSYYTIIRFGWTPALIGISMAVTGVAMIVSQGALTRVLITRFGGEQRTAWIGMSAGICLYLGYGLVPSGWMMFAVTALWLLVGLAWPSINAILSRQIPPNAQGELQGGLTCLGSLAAIVGPPLMTQILSYASASAPFYFPGASFVLAAALVMIALSLLRSRARAFALTQRCADGN